MLMPKILYEIPSKGYYSRVRRHHRAKEKTKMDKAMLKAVNEMADGKEKGLNKIFSATYNQIYSYLHGFAKEEDEILELMHAIYLDVYKNRKDAKQQEDIFSWIVKLATAHGKAYQAKQPDKTAKAAVEKTDKKLETEPKRLDVKKAQRVYDACCVLLGLKPTPIEEGDKKVIVSRKVKEKVKEVVVDEVEGAVKDEIKSGLLALIASLSTKAKVALLAGAVTTTAVTTGVVGTVIHSEEKKEIVAEASKQQEDLSDCIGLYIATMDGYEGDKLLEPVKTGEYEYTFKVEDIRKHFPDWEYAAIVIEELPTDMALAYYSSAIDEAGSDWIPSFTDSNVFSVSCSGAIKVYIVPTEDVEEMREHMYD